MTRMNDKTELGKHAEGVTVGREWLPSRKRKWG
jgi:hypothetical protein